MEAAPRLPMISFDLKTCSEPDVLSGSKLKQCIAAFYQEDPESFNNEIHNFEALRSAATRPSIDVSGCQTLKRYYCQLSFLKAKFPLEKTQLPGGASTSRKDTYLDLSVSSSENGFEMMATLYNIGALHTQLGASDSRTTSEGMKMSCTHFQCAAWCFSHLKETYSLWISLSMAPEMMHFMYQLCLAQAQECILEKSMMDNRKSTIIAKVAVQVVDYYNQACNTLTTGGEDGPVGDIVGTKTYKEWWKYLRFKATYHGCIALLYQGQQAEEQQKMGERVAFYQASSDLLEEARKSSKGVLSSQQHEIKEALAFTQDVVEGKKKAAKNENEFIYHEVVPEKDALPQISGASLVKPIPFNINDPEVSGPDIFSRLVPMEAHEMSSIYSEQKAEMLRQIGALVENKDTELSEFMSALQLESLQSLKQSGERFPQDIIDRAAALNAKPKAVQNLVEIMTKLAGAYHDVESLLEEIKQLIADEETREQQYQATVGARAPSIVATDLKREANKYMEAHQKANESNQTLHKAMVVHVSNLKLLGQPLSELQKQIPVVTLYNPATDEKLIADLENLLSKVDEMRTQRANLLAQLREAVCSDDITGLLVTRPANLTVDQLFQQELDKHKKQASLIQQNLAAQDNILKALTEAYAKFAPTRRQLAELIKKRETTINALIMSYDAYEDLLSKANKGIEFYNKLESNVSKLLQRLRSTCKVQDEEREQIMEKNKPPQTAAQSNAPKLKDYLATMKSTSATRIAHLPAVRPTPLGSEENSDNLTKQMAPELSGYNQTAMYPYAYPQNYYQQYPSSGNAGYQMDPNATGGYYQPSVETTQPSQVYQQQTYQGYQPTGKNYQTDVNYQSDPNKAYTQGYQSSVGASTTNIPGQNYQTDPSKGYMQGYQPNVGSATNIPVQNYQADVNQAYNQGYQSTGKNYQTDPNKGYQGYQPTGGSATNIPGQNYQTDSNKGYAQGYQPGGATATSIPGQNYQMDPTKGYAQGYQPSVAPATNIPGQKYQTDSSKGYPQGYQPNVGSAANIQNYQTDPSKGYTQGYQPSAGSASNVPVQNYQVNQNQAYQGYQPNAASAANIAGQNYQIESSQAGQMYYQTNPNQAYVQGYQPNASAPSNAPGKSYQADPNQSYVQGYQPVPSTSTNLPGKNYQVDPNQAYAQGYQTGQNQAYQPTPETTQAYKPGSKPPINIPGTSQQADTNQPDTNQPYGSPTSHHANPAVAYQISSGSTPYQISTTTNYPMYPNGMYPYQPDQNYQSENYYYTIPYGYQNNNQYGTYISANNSDSTATASDSATFAISHEQEPKNEPSNIDLLAGLDFAISQQPLEPQNTEQPKPTPEPTPKPEITEHKTEVTLATNVPTTVDAESLRTSKTKEPLVESEHFKQFVTEVEKLEKFVEGLTNKTLNGPTPLDIKWKEIQDVQEKDGQKYSISVARCYPMKNRCPDILPYDQSRVELPSTKDDYINASHIKNLSDNSPDYIVTQSPLSSTLADFWTMIWEQQVEVIVCLLGDTEIQAIYWPTERGQEIVFGRFKLSLQSANAKQHWTERIIRITDLETRSSHVVIHVQHTTWPGSLFPNSPNAFLTVVCAALAFYRQQRVTTRPILCHCLAGVGRSGLFCLAAAAVSEMTSGTPVLLDVSSVTMKMNMMRKNLLRDREHLRFAYQTVLYHAQELLLKQGILSTRSNFQGHRSRSHSRHPSQDILVDGITAQFQQAKLDSTCQTTHSNGQPMVTANVSQSMETSTSNTIDPLSELDPLWTAKKN